MRLEMLQVARLAPKLLGDSAALVHTFLNDHQNTDGGFKGRDGRSDLYYTVFGLDSLIALRQAANVPVVAEYLRSFGSGEGLDFVHLCCLARAWSAVSRAEEAKEALESVRKVQLLERVAGFRTPDGGFHPQVGGKAGTVYGCFLGLGAYQDLERELPAPLDMVRSLKFLETPDGAWANERGIKEGATNATAAAVTILRHLQMPIDARVGEWLLEQAHPQGGFKAMPRAPLPDLLSTATALHALSGLQIDLGQHKESCLDFIDSLWTNAGGFHGHWSDDDLDCEYTFYGLLSLGHLSI